MIDERHVSTGESFVFDTEIVLPIYRVCIGIQCGDDDLSRLDLEKSPSLLKQIPIREISPVRKAPRWPTSPESERWLASYTSSFEDGSYYGSILLRCNERRLVLLDENGIAIDVRLIQSDESVVPGQILEFPFYEALLGDCVCSHRPIMAETKAPLWPRRQLGPKALFGDTSPTYP